MLHTKKTPIRQVIDDIVSTNHYIASFWSQSHGWAPTECADLLSKSRLDRQTSLSACLRIWLRKPQQGQEDGQLILAWANLGTLIEGSMKFFLCVFAHNYANSPVIQRHSPVDPDGLMLEPLKQFFMKTVWCDEQQRRWGPFVDLVQQRRNGIHAYKHRDIGDRKEFWRAVRIYWEFVSEINGQVPYP